MSPDQYPVPAADVVAILKNHVYNRGDSRQRHAPMSRRALVSLLRVADDQVSVFARQLQHMQRNFKEHRICFQHYPTGWIYNPRSDSTGR